MKALRKEIALFLALTMLTVPLAGCSRTVTKGGLSGRGAVGDFLVGGLYGGVFGGFMRPGQPLPEGAFVVELPRPNDLRLTVELVGMDAMRYYTHARIATEKLSRMNAQNSKPEEYAKLLKETAELWKLADHFADMARQFAKHLSKEEKKPDYKPLAMIDKSPFGADIFFSVAYAREGTDADEERHRPMTGEERAAMEMHPDWAQGIVDAYKQYPAGKGIEGIADELGVDAKEANRKFQKAVSVLDQEKVFGIPTGMSNQTAGNLYNVGAKTAMVTKTGCQVILCVGGMILSGGALAATAGLAKQTVIVTNMAASFADTSVDIANTGHVLIYDKEDKELAEIKKTTGIISAVTSGVTLVTSFGDFALCGKDAVENTHKALEAANVGEYGLFNKYMNTSGVLDKYNIGGEGISAILDSAIWTGERIQDFAQDGEVLGFNVIGGDDGKPVFMPTAIPKGNVSPPIPIDQVADGTVDLLLTKEQAENRQNAVKELLEDIGQLEQQKQEALQQDAKDAPYTPDKIAGTYVLTSKREVKIDEKTAVRYDPQITIRAESGNRISMIRPNGMTTSINIDPQTGRGQFSNTIFGKTVTTSVQFTASGNGYIFRGTNKDGTATWRKQ